MENTRIVGMHFTCHQKWDAMTISENGRFCHNCKKEVFDFTERSIDGVLKENRRNNELCGRFSIEQVDPDFLMEIEVPHKIKKLAFWTSFFLAVSTKQSFAYTQTLQYFVTEQNDSSCDAPIFQLENTDKKVDINNFALDSSQKKANKKQKWNWEKRTKKHIIYATKKFPFIKFRRIRFAMGSPRFL